MSVVIAIKKHTMKKKGKSTKYKKRVPWKYKELLPKSEVFPDVWLKGSQFE